MPVITLAIEYGDTATATPPKIPASVVNTAAIKLSQSITHQPHVI
jgi:hypothetical protein